MITRHLEHLAARFPVILIALALLGGAFSISAHAQTTSTAVSGHVEGSFHYSFPNGMPPLASGGFMSNIAADARVRMLYTEDGATTCTPSGVLDPSPFLANKGVLCGDAENSLLDMTASSAFCYSRINCTIPPLGGSLVELDGDFTNGSMGEITHKAAAGTDISIDCTDGSVTIINSSAVFCNKGVLCWTFEEFEGTKTLRLVDVMKYFAPAQNSPFDPDCVAPRLSRTARLRHEIAIQSPDGCVCTREFIMVGTCWAAPGDEYNVDVFASYYAAETPSGGVSCTCSSAGSLLVPGDQCFPFLHENNGTTNPGEVVIDIELTPGTWRVTFNVTLQGGSGNDVAGLGDTNECLLEVGECGHEDVGSIPDGIIDAKDLALLARSIGSSIDDEDGCNYIASVDVDQNGTITQAEAESFMCEFMIDFVQDDFVDFFDYKFFMGAFGTGDCAADLNADGFVDFFDYDLFIFLYEEGLPCSDGDGIVCSL